MHEKITTSKIGETMRTIDKSHSFKIDLPAKRQIESRRDQTRSNSLNAFFAKLMSEERTRRDREREKRLARLRELQRYD